jgi:hypothetical protein
MSTTTMSNRETRMYFACPHVMNGDRIEIYLLNPNRKHGEKDKVLCAPCYWGPEPAQPPEALEKGGFVMVGPSGEPELHAVTEEEAIRRGWIPRSKAMRYLLSMSNDSTAGMAMSSRSKLMLRRGGRSGLRDIEVFFLHDLFTRGYESDDWPTGMVLTDEEEVTAQLLTDRMFNDDPADVAEIEKEIQEDPTVRATLEKYTIQYAEELKKAREERKAWLAEIAVNNDPNDPDPYLLPAQIMELWKAAFDNGWKKTDVIAFLQKQFNVGSPKELRQSQLTNAIDNITNAKEETK